MATQREFYDLKTKLPDYTHDLLNLCINFFDKAAAVRSVGIITPRDVGELYEISEEIIDEYMAIVMSMKYRDETVIRNVRKELYSIFNMFFDKDGRRKDWTDKWFLEKTEIRAEQVISTMTSFINSPIYTSLIQAYQQVMRRNDFLNKFVTISTYRAGKFPQQKKEKEEMDKLFGDLESDEDEEKSKKKKSKE
ncbi:MAG: hypothetical protein ACP5D2_02755 [Candidatus Nanoarchaeia archaeon]